MIMLNGTYFCVLYKRWYQNSHNMGIQHTAVSSIILRSHSCIQHHNVIIPNYHYHLQHNTYQVIHDAVRHWIARARFEGFFWLAKGKGNSCLPSTCTEHHTWLHQSHTHCLFWYLQWWQVICSGKFEYQISKMWRVNTGECKIRWYYTDKMGYSGFKITSDDRQIIWELHNIKEKFNPKVMIGAKWKNYRFEKSYYNYRVICYISCYILQRIERESYPFFFIRYTVLSIPTLKKINKPEIIVRGEDCDVRAVRWARVPGSFQYLQFGVTRKEAICYVLHPVTNEIIIVSSINYISAERFPHP